MVSRFPQPAMFVVSTTVFQGLGALSQVAVELDRRGLRRALVVSDKTLLALGHVARLEEVLGPRCAGVCVDVVSDSSPHSVEGAVVVGEAYDADVVVALGGGSVLDTAKLAAAVLGSEAPFGAHLGLDNVQGQPLPLLAIPTTTGTGSEVAITAMIKDADMGKKHVFRDAKLAPVAAFLDPALAMTQPPDLLAATAMDTLSHAMEALFSTWASPASDALALESARLVLAHLPGALAADEKETHVTALQWAASLAGMAFSNAAVGLVHALSHTIGARHNIHHGKINTVLLAPVLRFNQPAITPKAAAVARRLGLAAHAKTEEDAAAKLITNIEKLAASLPLPRSLKLLGVDQKAVPNMAVETLKEPCLFTNPREVYDTKVIEDLLHGLFDTNSEPGMP